MLSPNARFGSFASVWPDHGDFRSTAVNGHLQAGRACLKGANSSHGTHPELEATVAEESATDVGLA